MPRDHVFFYFPEPDPAQPGIESYLGLGWLAASGKTVTVDLRTGRIQETSNG